MLEIVLIDDVGGASSWIGLSLKNQWQSDVAVLKLLFVALVVTIMRLFPSKQNVYRIV